MSIFKILPLLFVLSFEMHVAMSANWNSSFSFDGFVKSPIFNKKVALFGDSKLVSNISSIQLTDSVSGSKGQVFYKKPIKLFKGKQRNSLSFSTYFSFSMPNEIGDDDVLAFVMVPSSLDLSSFSKKDKTSSALGFLLKYVKNETVVAFEFGISKEGNNARVLIGRPESAKIRNLSFVGDLMMNNGGRLSCMIEYEASSERMMVRFRKSGSVKLFDPFFAFSVDLGKVWKSGEVMVGLSSANGNSSNAHFLHLWNFVIRRPPPVWMHSELLEPKEVSEEEKEGRGGSEYKWRMVGALLLGLGCGTLGTMMGLYLWTICCVRRSVTVVPVECAVKTEASDVVVVIEEGFPVSGHLVRFRKSRLSIGSPPPPTGSLSPVTALT